MWKQTNYEFLLCRRTVFDSFLPVLSQEISGIDSKSFQNCLPSVFASSTCRRREFFRFYLGKCNTWLFDLPAWQHEDRQNNIWTDPCRILPTISFISVQSVTRRPPRLSTSALQQQQQECFLHFFKFYFRWTAVTHIWWPKSSTSFFSSLQIRRKKGYPTVIFYLIRSFCFSTRSGHLAKWLDYSTVEASQR